MPAKAGMTLREPFRSIGIRVSDLKAFTFRRSHTELRPRQRA
jgi:hypothetical protein